MLLKRGLWVKYMVAVLTGGKACAHQGSIYMDMIHSKYD